MSRLLAWTRTRTRVVVEVLFVASVLEGPAVAGVLSLDYGTEISAASFWWDEEEANLLIVAPLSGEADDGRLIGIREVTDGARPFVGKEISLSKNDHDVR